jgi:hypothetical protein
MSRDVVAPPPPKILVGGKIARICVGNNEDAYLLELLDGTLVDTSALVDQVTCEHEYVGVVLQMWRLLPVVVDLPESTWPMTTTLI